MATVQDLLNLGFSQQEIHTLTSQGQLAGILAAFDQPQAPAQRAVPAPAQHQAPALTGSGQPSGGASTQIPWDIDQQLRLFQANHITYAQLLQRVMEVNQWAGVPAGDVQASSVGFLRDRGVTNNPTPNLTPLTNLQAGSGSAGANQAQARALTEAEIYAKYNRGEYGTVGGAGAREAAIRDLYAHFQTTGMDQAAAAGRAIRSFEAGVGAGGAMDATMGGGAAGGGGTRPDGVPRATVQNVPPLTTAFASPEERRRQELSRNPQGRGQLFEEYLALQPQAPEIVRDQQREAFAPYQNLFEIGRGFGDIGIADTFERYLPARMTGGPDASYYRGQLGRVAGLLEGGDQSSAVTQAYLEDLRKNRSRQAGYIYEGLEPDVPFEFRSGVKRIGGERFDRAGDIQDIQRGLGTGAGGNPFRDYMDQGVSFAGPGQDQYLGSVNATADFLAGPGTGERDVQSDFRKQLGENQVRQFEMAKQSQRQNIPWELRDTWENSALEAFRRWSARAPAGDQFLPYARSRGYQFAGM